MQPWALKGGCYYFHFTDKVSEAEKDQASLVKVTKLEAVQLLTLNYIYQTPGHAFLVAMLFASRIHFNPKLKHQLPNVKSVILVPITTISKEAINCH